MAILLCFVEDFLDVLRLEPKNKQATEQLVMVEKVNINMLDVFYDIIKVMDGVYCIISVIF